MCAPAPDTCTQTEAATGEIYKDAMAASVPARQLYIDGRWQAPVQGKTLDVINPATEQVIGQIPAATEADVQKAVAAARAAAKAGAWGKATGAHRAGFLRAIANKVRQQVSLQASSCYVKSARDSCIPCWATRCRCPSKLQSPHHQACHLWPPRHRRSVSTRPLWPS